MEKQREAFEKWAKSEYPNNPHLHFEWTAQYSHYVLDEVQFAFEAWQAAQADTLELARIGLRDWETPENRYKALRAIDAALAMPEDGPAPSVPDGPLVDEGSKAGHSAPEGWQLVPIDPTPEMVLSARMHHEGHPYLPVSVYRAMLAAAPEVKS